MHVRILFEERGRVYCQEPPELSPPKPNIWAAVQGVNVLRGKQATHRQGVRIDGAVELHRERLACQEVADGENLGHGRHDAGDQRWVQTLHGRDGVAEKSELKWELQAAKPDSKPQQSRGKVEFIPDILADGRAQN